MVNENFCSDKKLEAIFGPKKFGHFRSKIRFSDIFFKTAHQICLKLGQKLGTIALCHLKAVLCPGKFLFWPFLGQKYIACGDKLMFLTLLSLYFQNGASDFDDFCTDAIDSCPE